MEVSEVVGTSGYVEVDDLSGSDKEAEIGEKTRPDSALSAGGRHWHDVCAENPARPAARDACLGRSSTDGESLRLATPDPEFERNESGDHEQKRSRTSTIYQLDQ